MILLVDARDNPVGQGRLGRVVGIQDRANPRVFGGLGVLPENDVAAVVESDLAYTRIVADVESAKVDDPAQGARMALDGLKLTERFIVLLRRKMMLRAIQELRMDAETESTGTGD